MYQVYFTKNAIKDFESLNTQLQNRIKLKLDLIKQDPFYPNNNLKRLIAIKDGFRLRIDRYRVLFFIITKTKQLIITNIFIKKNQSDYTKRIDLLNLIKKGY